MPKRKRDNDDALEETAGNSARQRRINYKLQQSRLKLAHAFKIAKSFERMKLDRREKTAKSSRNEKDIARIANESAALKVLDLSAAAHLLLHKSLAKIKAVTQSELFEGFLASAPSPLQGSEAQNVYARLCNSQAVRDALRPNLDEILQAAAIEGRKTLSKTKETDKRAESGRLGSTSEQEATSEGEDQDEEDVADSGSDDDFADYQGRLASSGDEDSDTEDLSVAQLERQLKSEGIKEDFTESDAESEVAMRVKDKPSKKTSAAPVKPTSSILLPSLTMGGYISASDGSDVEEIDVAPRKNRPGQRARQAIWEKKYGQKAKHLKDSEKSRDSGWDMKRGATGGSKRSSRQRMSAGAPDNAAPIRKPARKKDDTGPLHPSWVAAKRAKEQKANSTFTGTKISFD